MTYEVEKTASQWHEELSLDRFSVLREAATKAPFTG